MPRDVRSDKGKTHSRGNYNTKKIEPRGLKDYEFRLAKYFWKQFKMEDVITWDAEKLEAELEDFYNKYEELQVARNKGWWYPEDPMSIVLKKNKPSKESKYKAEGFNGKIDTRKKK
jgi:hypothetical protein